MRCGTWSPHPLFDCPEDDDNNNNDDDDVGGGDDDVSPFILCID